MAGARSDVNDICHHFLFYFLLLFLFGPLFPCQPALMPVSSFSSTLCYIFLYVKKKLSPSRCFLPATGIVRTYLFFFSTHGVPGLLAAPSYVDVTCRLFCFALFINFVFFFCSFIFFSFLWSGLFCCVLIPGTASTSLALP